MTLTNMLYLDINDIVKEFYKINSYKFKTVKEN